MVKKSIARMDLKRLILVLTVLSALISLGNTFYAAYSVQHQQLIDAAKNSNYVYATKLAKSTNDFLVAAKQQLSVSAAVSAKYFNDKDKLTEEAGRLKIQTNSFNSVVILDKDANVLASSPSTLQLTGKKLTTPGIVESIKTRQPVISDQYISTVGNLVVFVSHPIFGSDGNYLGAIGGTIYLKQDSILNHLLGQHFHTDGSYLYVVDRNKNLIYHPDPERVGQKVEGNQAIDDLSNGKSGSSIVINSRGIEMIAGYSVVPTTGWGIVAQRPMSGTLAPLGPLMLKVVTKTMPIALVSLLLVWWCARQIARPLRYLANSAHAMADPEAEKNIQKVKAWYFEAYELKKAMMLGISLLNQSIRKLREDVQTDPLTSLGNRRSLDSVILKCQSINQNFSVISIDIDHFKKVNDTFGHDVGDIVLRDLAKHMQSVCRSDDVPCRVGGEEFLIVLPRTSEEAAIQVAERLRKQVETTLFDSVGHITISLGVANWPNDSEDVQAVLKYADEMLYKAKRAGRNRVEVYEAENYEKSLSI